MISWCKQPRLNRPGPARPVTAARPVRKPAPPVQRVSPTPELDADEASLRLLRQANRALARHDWEASLDAYTAVLGLRHSWAEVHYLLGVLHKKVGDAASAERCLRRTLFLNEDFWPATWLLAGVVESRGARDQGRRLRRSALRDANRVPSATLFRSDDVTPWIPDVRQMSAHPAIRPET